MKKLFCFLFMPFLIFAKLEEKPLVIGTTSGYAPYVSLDERGSYVGFDIDFANLLAKKLNRALEIKDFGSMPGLMLALKQGKVDALIWAISITEERQKSLEMIYYQGEITDQMPIVFWKEIPQNFQSLEELEKGLKRPVSVEAGSYQESVLRDYPKIELKNLASISDAILDLKYGKSVATCLDLSLISRLQKQYPDLKVLKLSLPKEKQSFGNGICIRKDNLELIQEIRRAVEEIAKTNEVKELEKKWGLSL